MDFYYDDSSIRDLSYPASDSHASFGPIDLSADAATWYDGTQDAIGPGLPGTLNVDEWYVFY